MDKKFTFKIEEIRYDNGIFIDREFNNQYGKWHIHVGNLSKNIKFLLFFIPNVEFPGGALKNLKINVKFINSNYHHFSFNKVAVQRANSTLYEFSANQNGLSNSSAYFTITVEVDAASLAEWLTPCDLPVWSSFTGKVFNEGTFTDIKIKTHDGHEIKANKMILSRSPVFDAMLNLHDTREAQQNIIEVTDINHEVMTEMIRYMYTDKIPKLEEIALDLIIAANKYMLPGLVYETERYLRQNINIQNFEEIAVIAENLNLTKLKASIVKFLIDNRNTILTTAEWKSFKEKNIQPVFVEAMENCIEVMKYSTN